MAERCVAFPVDGAILHVTSENAKPNNLFYSAACRTSTLAVYYKSPVARVFLPATCLKLRVCVHLVDRLRLGLHLAFVEGRGRNSLHSLHTEPGHNFNAVAATRMYSYLLGPCAATRWRRFVKVRHHHYRWSKCGTPISWCRPCMFYGVFCVCHCPRL